MKPFWSSLFTILTLLLGLTACNSSYEVGKGVTYQIPWIDAAGNSSFRQVELLTLEEPKTFRGQAADIYLRSFVAETGVVGAIPQMEFLETRQGLRVAKNVDTLQVMTVYAHMEFIWNLEKRMGLASLVPRPRKIGLAKRGGELVGGFTHNNAFYFQQQDAVLILPTTDGKVPLTVSGGLLAHEHFHAIFSASVLRPLETSGFRCNPMRIENIDCLLLRSLNEGLADFFAWLYTGDDDFVMRSLPELSERSMDGVVDPLPKREALATVKKEQGQLSMQTAYRLGTQFARHLRQEVLKAPRSQQNQVSRQILSNLLQIPKLFLQAKTASELEPEAVLQLLINSREEDEK